MALHTSIGLLCIHAQDIRPGLAVVDWTFLQAEPSLRSLLTRAFYTFQGKYMSRIQQYRKLRPQVIPWQTH
jgi:hypothetical protein